MLSDRSHGSRPGGYLATASGPLAHVVGQVWGAGIERGEVRVSSGPAEVERWSLDESYWVTPSRRAAQVLIPRNPEVAARAMFDYARLRSPRTRVLRRVLGSAAYARLPLSRDVLNIYTRHGATSIIGAVGRSIGHSDAVATLGVRVGANAKPTLELRRPEGDLLGFAKLGWNDLTMRAVRNEAESLRMFNDVRGSAILAPSVLAEGLVQDRQFVVTEALPKDIADVRANPSALSGLEIYGPGTVHKRSSWGSIRQVMSVRDEFDSASDLVPPALQARARAVTAELIQRAEYVPVADFWHGDFVPWNVGRDAQRRLWLFDWETVERDVPAGLDSMHWIANSLGDRRFSGVVERIGEAALRAQPALRSLGYSPQGAAALPAWYALTLTSRAMHLAASLGSWDRVQLKPSVLIQLVEWAASRLGTWPNSRRAS